METLLNHLMNALPIMAGLTSAVPRPVEHELQTLVPDIVRMGFNMGSSLIAAVTLKQLGGVITGLFLTIFGVVVAVTSRSSQEVNTVKIELGNFKVAWTGVAAMGCIVAGTLFLAFSLYPTSAPPSLPSLR